MESKDLKLIVLENCKELGDKINNNIKLKKGTTKDFFTLFENSRFSNGEGKVTILESLRGKDVYIISDVGNYNISYNFHGRTHYMSPDEHFQDIKRVISAINGHAEKITLILPLLYQSRQHRRKGMESLDLAMGLQELEKLGVNNIISFDVHDPSSSFNALHNTPFSNFYPTNIILDKLIDDNPEDMTDLLVVSPDMGAVERARHYAEIFGCNVGMFYKRRDLTKVVNGKNPIIEHVYLGDEVKGKNILVVDDMIASGQSMIEVATELKEKGANKIFLIASFALFSEGTKMFEEAYNKKLFDKIYTTNFSYVPEEVKTQPWYTEADCSGEIAKVILAINNNETTKNAFNEKDKIVEKMQRVRARTL